jgi:phosphatidylglycerophosphatase GEP4
MGIPVLIHSKKPSEPELLCKRFNCKGDEIVVVGDRLLTDVVYGNKIGAFTVLTRQVVSLVGDNPIAIRIRRMEHRLLDVLTILGLVGTHPRGNDYSQ